MTATDGDNIERCFICAVPFKAGDMVLPDVNEGLGHRGCFGEDREGYHGEDGGPLRDDEEIPEGYEWEPDTAMTATDDKPISVDRDSSRILLQFADMYRSGAHGAEIDCDAAQALALSIDDALQSILRTACPPAGVTAFQERVQPWMTACFGLKISSDRLERGDRLLEEVFELLQSGEYPRERVRALEEYVWARDVGEPAQEVGGVMVTLAAYCLAHDLDMHQSAETELARIWTKVEKIRAKQAAKPKGSALPVALSSQAQPNIGVYSYVPMPIDGYGNGPASLRDTVKTLHQIWDLRDNHTVAECPSAEDAQALVRALASSLPEGEAK